MVRTFIAIDLGQETKDIIESKVLDEISKIDVDVKLVEKENLHLTLKFLGEIHERRVSDVKEVLERISSEKKKFSMRLHGLGAFPNSRSARVVWIGVEDGREELHNLASEIDSELHKIGFKRERKRFHPHITVCRVKTPRNISKIRSLIEALRDLEVGVEEVNCLSLKKSTLTSKGPIYEDLHKFPLQD
ncbi:RNA 2',3'-cyclic phosphodiesterase [Thermococci archaeon]|mgnify:CR=1 FL=1|nr:MAG: RNA 2',3'-cyclic phosphodiesterase [Thermococci archaeon]